MQNFVTRVTVRHLEACRVMPNSFPPSDGIFNSHLTTIIDSLPSTAAFRLEYMLFYRFHAKITTFSS